MTYTIEKGIPAPEDNGKRGRLPIYSQPQMEVGDSIFFPSYDNRDLRKLRSSFRQYGLRHNTHYVVRSIEGGVRVWRVD